MPTVEELEGQKRVLEERKLGLQKYDAEIRRISGEMSYVTYRQNSGMGSHAGNIKTKDNLRNELEAKIAGLKRDYQLVPHLIPRQISQYDGEISRITIQVTKMGTQEAAQAYPPEPGEGEPPRNKAGEPSSFAGRLSGMAQQHLARQPESSRDGGRTR